MKNSEVTKTYINEYVAAIMLGPFVVECYVLDAYDSLFRDGGEEQEKLATEYLVLSVDRQDLSPRGGAALEAYRDGAHIERLRHDVEHLVRGCPVDGPGPHMNHEGAVVAATNVGAPRARMDVDFYVHRRRRSSRGLSIPVMHTSSSEPIGCLAPPRIR
jgi:hypothetical protein